MAQQTDAQPRVFNKFLDTWVPKQEFKRSLFIGLGGSGAKILTRLKRYFTEQYGGEVPPSKAFFAIDTDDDLPRLDSVMDERGIQLDRRTEFYHLKVSSPLTFVQNSPPVQQWLIAPCPTQAITAGTGAVRQAGRLALFAHSHEVFHRIRKAFDKLRSVNLPTQMEALGYEVTSDAIEVYICGSIAGGTGSGTFLDVGIFCRKSLPADTMIYAVLIGPWVYRDVGATFRTPANAYAALMELDYIMSIGEGKRSRPDLTEDFRVTYDREELIVDQPPFNVVHLVDGMNQQGMVISGPNELVKFVAEAVFLSTSANVGKVLRSAVDNILTITTTSSRDLWQGKPAYYSSFGAAAAVYPAAQYVTRGTYRFSCKVLESLATQVSEGVPVDESVAPEDVEDVRKFLKLNRLDVDAGPVVLDQIFDVGSLPQVKLMPPEAGTIDRSYPASLAASVQKKYDRFLDTAHASFEDPTNRVVEAVRSYLEHGSSDALSPTTGARRAARLRHLSKTIKHVVLKLAEEIQKKSAEVQDAGQQVEGRLADIDTIVRTKGFLTSMSTIAKRIGEVIPSLKSAVESKLRAQVDLERTSAFQGALAQADRQLTEALQRMAGARTTTSELGALVADALRIQRTRSQTTANLDVRAGLSDFEELIPLVQEVPDDEDVKAAEAASTLLSRLRSGDRPLSDLSAQDFIEAAEAVGAAYAKAVYDQGVNLLDLIEARQQRVAETGRSDDETYVQSLLSKLEFVGQPLWHYDPGVITTARAQEMTSLIILGAPNRARALKLLGDYEFANKCKPNIVATGDPHRITLIYMATCLPIYVLSEVPHYRERYNGLFVPPIHSNRYFEMQCESLVPEKSDENLAFQILSLGIIPGIDVITDEKAQKGKAGRYRLVQALEPDPDFPVRDLKPSLGDKFLLAYSYLVRHPFVREQVMNQLAERLERLREEDPDRFRAIIDRQIEKLEKEIAARQVSKIITWRAMQREVALLSRLRVWPHKYNEFLIEAQS